MEVIKRNGDREKVYFDKITTRISNLCYGLDPNYVNPIKIAQETINGVYDGITTQQLDLLSADICASKLHHHPDMNTLASRIVISNLHKQTDSSYLNVVKKLHSLGRLSDNFYNFVLENESEIQSYFDYSRDFLFDFFGFKTLERSYLLKEAKNIVERPQHMWMRVAIQIHGLHPFKSNLKKLKETYDYLSNLYFTHATPTLFNAGTNRTQLASCYLFNCSDNIEHIFKVISDIAQISKWAGGIGLNLSNIRSKGSIIRGTGGKSEGIIPLCKTLESVGRYINQGGKRNGSIAVYLEPWHSDIFDFCELRKNVGDENLRARDLFLALWVPDLFMERVKNNEVWSLMCPSTCPGLNNIYGEEFEKVYLTYEKEGKFTRQVKATELWKVILESQLETGMPYFLFKDSINRKSNQKNIGVITNSNLCVAPETQILTDKGYFQIKTLENQQINVWNGEEFSKVTILKTGENQKLLKVKFSNGMTLRCTPYHKFRVQQGDDILEVEAKDLKENMQLIDYKLPVINTVIEGQELICSIPLNSSIETKISWLRSNMTVNISKNGFIYDDEIVFCNMNKEYIHTLFLFFSSLGLFSKIKSSKLSNGDKLHFLYIKNSELAKLQKYGLSSETFNYISKPKKHIIRVKSIKDKGELSDTYCFNEPKKHQGIFNGILTMNCSEIVEYCSEDETSVCTLGSICLQKFVINKKFDYALLGKIARIATRNLNNVIDINFYPIPETKNSNIKHRPIGLGVQGLADTYFKMDIPFDSEEARKVNKKIFETIYYHALSESNEIAKERGAYSTFKGSPFSEGMLQWHLWGLKESDMDPEFNYDWYSLIESIKEHGVSNSLITTVMPTASTSIIMNQTECIEPITSNIYVRKTLAGEYTVVNKYLMNDLIELGLWSKELYEELLYFNGSVSKIKEIPQHIKNKYKTAFEISQKEIIQQSLDRGPFIDQTQSLNQFQAIPDASKLTSAHFYGWKNGIKTGLYYLRTQPAVDPIKFGLDQTSVIRIENKYDTRNQDKNQDINQAITQVNESKEVEPEIKVCRRRQKGESIEGCDMCSG
jgi:ribonucleotide reductase alpha subunit